MQTQKCRQLPGKNGQAANHKEGRPRPAGHKWCCWCPVVQLRCAFTARCTYLADELIWPAHIDGRGLWEVKHHSRPARSRKTSKRASE
jgi:hypothetical protein